MSVADDAHILPSSSSCRDFLSRILTKPIYGGDYSSLTSTQSVENALVEADLMIQHIVEHQNAIRVYQNALLPVSHLPTELLLSIFHLCVPDVEDYRAPDRRPLTWFAFSRVCRWWHDLSLSDPTLWTTPPFLIPRLAIGMVPRAQGLPLHISIDWFLSGGSADLLGAMDRLFPSWQLASLEIRAPAEQTRRCIAALTSTGPHFSSLALLTNRTATLTYNGLWQMAPLASLRLHRCMFPHDSPVLRNLGSLRLSFEPNMDANIRHSVKSVLKILRNNTTLRRLHLTNAVESRAPIPPLMISPSDELIVFPHLKDLTIEDDLPCALALLGKLSIPKVETFLFVESRPHIDTPPNHITMAILGQIVRRWLDSRGAGPMHSIKCTEKLGTLTLDYSWDRSRANYTGSQDQHSAVQLKLRLYGHFEIFFYPVSLGTIDTLFRAHPLQDLRSLDISVESWTMEPASSSSSCWKYIASLPSLSSLKLNGHRRNILAFFNCLGDDSTESDALFPMLRSLEIGQQIMSLDYFDVHSRVSLSQQLSGFLHLAAARGRPLDNVLLVDCVFTPVSLEELDVGRMYSKIRLADPQMVGSSLEWWENVEIEA